LLRKGKKLIALNPLLGRQNTEWKLTKNCEYIWFSHP